MALSGLILVSCAMDLQSLVFAPANDLPYALFLPAFANAAQYHGLLQGPLAASPAAARAAAEAYVQEDYVAALHAGARMGDKQRSARRDAAWPSSPACRAQLVEEKNLRISDHTFFFDALRSRGPIVGRLESRATGPMAASRTREWEFDPGIEAIAAPYSMAAHGLLRRAARPPSSTSATRCWTRDVNKGWNWNRGEAAAWASPAPAPDLARALRRNPHLRCWPPAGATTSARPTARATGRWRNSTCRPR